MAATLKEVFLAVLNPAVFIPSLVYSGPPAEERDQPRGLPRSPQLVFRGSPSADLSSFLARVLWNPSEALLEGKKILAEPAAAFFRIMRSTMNRMPADPSALREQGHGWRLSRQKVFLNFGSFFRESHPMGKLKTKLKEWEQAMNSL